MPATDRSGIRGISAKSYSDVLNVEIELTSIFSVMMSLLARAIEKISVRSVLFRN